MRPLIVVLSIVVFESLPGRTLAQSSAKEYNPRIRADTMARDLPYVHPKVLRASASGTHVDLKVSERIHTFDGLPFRHRSYNDDLVGPVIRVRPGTSLTIDLKNDLPVEPTGTAHASSENTPHGYNTTNLHTHGLHVSPRPGADDVFLQLPPKKSKTLTFDIRPDHPAGTFWYHAHKHGSTAVQLAGGMAGALIVEGGLDEAPGIKGITEQVLVLQQFVCTEDPDKPGEFFVDPDLVNQGLGDIKQAVNGQIVPTLKIRPGEVQRWRLIHAGILEVINLELPGVELYEIAIDGIALGACIKRDRIQLYPGYRSDILVKAPSTPGLRVLATEVSDPAESLLQRTLVETDVLKLSIEGTPTNMTVPSSAELKSYAPLTDADVPRDDQLAFRKDLKFASNDTTFLINNAEFSSSATAQEIELNTAGEWTLTSELGQHPFHIHVNPFAVHVDDDGTGQPRWIWRDTLFVRRNQPQKVRSWFKSYTGETVLHCHILYHEDRGMMQKIEFVPASTAARTPEAFPPSPRATVSSPDGRRIELGGKLSAPLLLVFHRGMVCPHCAEQLGELGRRADEFRKLGVELAAISQELPADDEIRTLRKAMSISYPLWADEKLEAFRRFGCIDAAGETLHGVFLLGANGQVRWQTIGPQAENDIDRLLRMAKRHLTEAHSKGAQ